MKPRKKTSMKKKLFDCLIFSNNENKSLLADPFIEFESKKIYK
jgi:hypothetical protein